MVQNIALKIKTKAHTDDTDVMDRTDNSQRKNERPGWFEILLPDHFQPFVQAEFLVGSADRDVFGNSLSNDSAIEGVEVMERQLEQLGMLSCVGQDAQTQVGHSSDGLLLVDGQFAARLFDREFGKRNGAQQSNRIAFAEERYCPF